MRKGANLFQEKKNFRKPYSRLKPKVIFKKNSYFKKMVSMVFLLRKMSFESENSWFQFIFQRKKFNSNFLIWEKIFEKTLNNGVHTIFV